MPGRDEWKKVFFKRSKPKRKPGEFTSLNEFHPSLRGCASGHRLRTYGGRFGSASDVKHFTKSEQEAWAKENADV